MAVFAALLLASILFFFFGTWQTAFVPGVLCLFSLLWILIQLVRSLASEDRRLVGDRFGKGPYVRVDCGSGKQMHTKLKTITEKLLNSVREQKRQVDMKVVQRFIVDADAAVAESRYSDSVKAYSRCISFLMDSLRGGS